MTSHIYVSSDMLVVFTNKRLSDFPIVYEPKIRIFRWTKFQQVGEFLTNNRTEIDLPTGVVPVYQQEHRENGRISNGIVFFKALARALDPGNDQGYGSIIMLAVRIKDKAVERLNINYGYEDPFELRILGTKYFPQAGIVCSGFRGLNSLCWLRVWRIDNKTLKCAWLSDTEPVNFDSSDSNHWNYPTATFRMIRGVIYCLAKNYFDDLQVYTLVGGKFVIRYQKQFKDDVRFCKFSRFTKETPLYAYKLLSSRCGQPNVYQIYRLQLKF